MTGPCPQLPVHMVWDADADALGILRERLGSNVTLTVGRDGTIPPECRVLVAGRVEASLVAPLAALERLVVPWAGIPPAIREIALARPGLRLHNLHHNAAATAETAMALLLAAAKFLVPHDHDLRLGDWTRRYGPSPSMVLEGRTALVLGFGAIGRRVARACQGLGMEVRATRRGARSVEHVDGVAVHPADALDGLLRGTAALIVTLPLTEETDGLLGKAELAHLTGDSVLVNVARGPIVDEVALYEALASGALGAAGLDVWYQYPRSEEARAAQPPAKLPFGELENVVLSPHRAGSARDNDVRRMTALADLLNAIARGGDVPGHVDAEAGY